MTLDSKLIKHTLTGKEGRVRAWKYSNENRCFMLLVQLRQTNKFEVWQSNAVEALE